MRSGSSLSKYSALRSCARFNGPPVTRTSCNGNGRATGHDKWKGRGDTSQKQGPPSGRGHGNGGDQGSHGNRGGGGQGSGATGHGGSHDSGRNGGGHDSGDSGHGGGKDHGKKR